ncbi:MAG: lysophospholipid acyltransferase family protein [Gemmataceae bacterium]
MTHIPPHRVGTRLLVLLVGLVAFLAAIDAAELLPIAFPLPLLLAVAPLFYWRGYRIVGLLPLTTTLIACGAIGTLFSSIEALFPLLIALGVLSTVVVLLRYALRRPWSGARLRPGRPRLIWWLWLLIFWNPLLPRLIPPEWAMLVVGLTLCGAAWVWFLREGVELAIEPLLALAYPIQSRGVGLASIPADGPLLIVANHGAYLDPLFLAKFLPRPITPMMTSRFFDLPIIRPLVSHVFNTIRVPDATVRRETPEIAEAIAALDAGHAVVIFPEGYLRRKEEVALRRFGRGIHEILRQRPNTPIVCCWIEGSWGSYFSFWNGPPMKNKPLLRRRSITIGVGPCTTIPRAMLDHHMTTRQHGMKLTLAARAELGLPPLNLTETEPLAE